MPFDTEDLCRNSAQDRRRVTRTSPDLEHPLGRLEPQRLDREGDDVRLRNGLAFAYRQRPIVVGKIGQRGCNE